MLTIDSTLDQKLVHMRSILRDLETVAVAFSAGVDSTLVLKVALDVLGPQKVVAVTGRSDSLARDEFDQAVELAAAVGAEHVILDTDEFQNPNYTSNPANRCYFCKTTLYDHMECFVARRDIKHIINGINTDDLGDFRPGIQAAREHAVRCPAAEAGLTKADVRELSRRLGLPTFDKPASPCLSSRVPYGQPVTPDKLRMIEAAEKFLHALGFRECRVRHYQVAGNPSRDNQYRDHEGAVWEGKAPAEPRTSVRATPIPLGEGRVRANPNPERERRAGSQYRDREGAKLANAETPKRRNAETNANHSARIEVPLADLPRASAPPLVDRIRQHLHSLGYDEITFDPRGFRSGSLNEAILVNISKS